MGSRQARKVDLGEAGAPAPASAVNLWLARLLQAGLSRELSWAACDRLTAAALGLSRDFWRRVRSRGPEHPLALLLAGSRRAEILAIDPQQPPKAPKAPEGPEGPEGPEEWLD